MAHPTVDNRTPFAFEPLFMAGEDGQPLLVLVTKATYVIASDRDLALAEEQLAVNVAGEHWGDPETTSYKYEPEGGWQKPTTDIVLIAHAWAPKTDTAVLDVGFSVGPLRKVARVFGDRVWVSAGATTRATRPRPFESVPLTYEHAFGGWDRSFADEKLHTFEPRNPIGLGFRHKKGRYEDGVPLANVEDPNSLIKRYHDRPVPMGFGFTSPHWEPRASLAGTFDEAWVKERQPLIPKDFDRRHLNAASPGLAASGYLVGKEPVRGLRVSKSGQLAFDLPGEPPPTHRVALKHGDVHAEAKLDTVIVNTDDNVLFLLWRAELALRHSPLDVTDIVVDSPTGGA